MEMKRSSGWRWWPSSQLTAVNRKKAPASRTRERIARAVGRFIGMSAAKALGGHRESLAREKGCDLRTVRGDPFEQPVHAFFRRDPRLPAELALGAADVAIESALV